jgi:hypothetical protein
MASAVITGDVVNYTGLSKPDQQILLQDLSEKLEGSLFDFYRGDSFSVFLPKPETALKLTLQLRLVTLKYMDFSPEFKTDLRASIGIGQVDEPVSSLKTATGEAFIISGRNLDDLSKSGPRLVIQAAEPSLNMVLGLIADFMDYLFSQLTAKQAEVIAELLNGTTQMEAARALNKSQATISQHVQSAGWAQIHKLLGEYEEVCRLF